MDNSSDAIQVLLDANIFIDDALMRRGPFRLLLEQSRRGSFRLLVPELVVMETVNHRRKMMESARREFRKAAREVARLFSLDNEPQQYLYLDVNERTRAYERAFREKLEMANATILDFPSVGHKELTRKAIRAAKPFREGDRGYRDSLIWQSVVESLANGRTAFVTNNVKDFGGPEGILAPELREELIELRVDPDRLNSHESLKDFTDQNIPASYRALDAFNGLLEAESFYEEVENLVMETIDYDLAGSRSFYLISRASPQNINVRQAFIHDISATDARGLTGSEFVVDLRVKAEIVVQFHVLKDELHLIDSRRDLEAIIDPDAEEHYALGEVDFEELVLEMEADFDHKTGSIRYVDLIGAS